MREKLRTVCHTARAVSKTSPVGLSSVVTSYKVSCSGHLLIKNFDTQSYSFFIFYVVVGQPLLELLSRLLLVPVIVVLQFNSRVIEPPPDVLLRVKYVFRPQT